MQSLRELYEDVYAAGAYDYAKEKHGSQKRAHGAPYITHPEMVSKILDAYGADDTLLTASLFHDVLEDTGTEWNELRDRWGEDVADIVSELTNDKKAILELTEYYRTTGHTDPKLDAKREYMNKHMIELNSNALTIKLADILANSLDKPKPGQRERMRDNVLFLTKHRRLNQIQKELVESILQL
jgi:(p)ppGpp synthase/HD superfamily hydrolase